MKRFFLFSAVLGLCLGSVWAADEMVQKVQSRLKARGFYQGSPNGVYDSETSAAVTRYQIRNGLAISGKLDAATLKALKVTPSTETSTPEALPQEGTWRRLRNGDMQFLEDLNAGKIPPPATPPTRSNPVDATPVPSPARKSSAASRSAPPEHVRSAEPSSPRSFPPEEVANALGSNDLDMSRERLRDYVAAFVLAGLDPHTGAELEFFADGVNYFGERNVSREKVRRDLIRYDRRWPVRRFWLAGDLEIHRQDDGKVRVTFPLRYDLRRGAAHAAGMVIKTIVLQQSRPDDFKIVAVNEKKI